MEGYDYCRFTIESYHRFGFNSVEQMNKWFSFEDQIIMLANGFKLTTYKDSDVRIDLVTPCQVVFALKSEIPQPRPRVDFYDSYRVYEEAFSSPIQERYKLMDDELIFNESESVYCDDQPLEEIELKDYGFGFEAERPATNWSNFSEIYKQVFSRPYNIEELIGQTLKVSI
jgi:hypothetical protein